MSSNGDFQSCGCAWIWPFRPMCSSK